MNLSKKILHTILFGAVAMGMASCDFMHEELPACPVKPNVETRVRFVYDYHTRLDNRLASDVGSVILYVYDSDGRLVARETRSNLHNDNALKADDFHIDLDLAAGDYEVYAVGQGNHEGYDGALRRPGAKFRITEPALGESLSKFNIRLDHNNGRVDNAGVMIDTLWTTLRPEIIRIPEILEPQEGDPQPDDVVNDVTIPLMRVTNHLSLSFYRTDLPQGSQMPEYDVWVESRTGRDSFDIFGNYFENAHPLIFTPYKSSPSAKQRSSGSMTVEFGLPRFIMHEKREDHTILCFRNKETDKYMEVDLVELLGAGNAAYAEYNWSVQEYLDREYDYELELALTPDSWDFATISIKVLSWSKRIQNVNL